MIQKKIITGPATLYLGDCFDILPELGYLGHVITDPPFGEAVHRQHDAHESIKLDRATRRKLGFAAWGLDEAQQLVSVAGGQCGWMVVFTNFEFGYKWFRSMKNAGRITFPALPFHDAGRSIRFNGDGPSSWTDWIIVSRTKAQKDWGCLPGGYVRKTNHGKSVQVGGKPVGIMKLLVRDYSREGDLVTDPCMGSGTTGLAAVAMNRKFIGIEIDPGRFETACKRIRIEWESKSHNLFAKR